MFPNGKGRAWNDLAQLLAIVLVVLLLSACTGTPYRRSLGIRPDAPSVTTPQPLINECARLHPTTQTPANPETPSERAACEQYLKYKEWAQELVEAYRSRASLNEYAIYAAGTIALAGLSVVSGLGLAAAASTETIGLVGVSTGFTSGFFGFINNSAKAGFYTNAANQISTTLSEATKAVGDRPTSETYGKATQILAARVSQTANELETKQYETAAAAAVSQQVQQAARDLQETMAIMETALLIRLDKEGVPISVNEPVIAMTSRIDLKSIRTASGFWSPDNPQEEKSRA